MVPDYPQTRVLQQAGVLSLGTDYRPQAFTWGRGIRPTYLLYYVIEGVVYLENEQGRACAGEVLCLPPQVPKRLLTTDTPIKAAYLHLKDDEPWISLPGEHFTVHKVAHARLVYDAAETLRTEVLSKTPEACEAAEHLSQLILHYIMRFVNVTDSPQELAIRSQLIGVWHQVADHVAHPWSVSELAELAHMSEGHFHREVQRLFGVKPMQIVCRLRMEQAAALLKTTSLDLRAVATQVGYSTPYALSNAFVREMGVRPGIYRRQ
jgi:AraC-like DNA-binding protein